MSDLSKQRGNKTASTVADFSSVGFNKAANKDVIGTFRETIANIDALPKVPEFLLYTGDLTCLSDPGQFETLA